MADPTKGWHAVFDKGSKQAQEKLKKAHGHKPEFQAFLKSRGAEGGERSAKQATTSLKKATDAKIAAQKIADMRFKKALQVSSDRVREMGRRRRESGEGLGGGLESNRDIVAYVKQHGSIKAGRLGEETMNEVTKKEAEAALGGPVKDKPKGPAGKLPLGFRMARSAARKAMKGQVDAVHRSMEKTMKKEEVEQVIEQDDSMEKKEMAQTQLHFMAYAAKEILEFIDMGGEIEEWYQNKLSKVQSEVESLHSYIEGEKRRTGMVKEEEQIDEFVDRETRLAARKAETGSSTRVSSGDVLGRRGGHETPKQAIARRVGKDSYGIKSGGKTSIYNRSPKPNLPEEAEQVDEKAPPGAKYERMVKHIKKGYAKGGLTPQEKSIAYATAWKAYGKKEEVEQVEEGAKDWKRAFSAVAQKNLQKDVGAMRSKVGRLNYIGMQPKVDATPKVTAALTKKGTYAEEVVTEAEGTVAVTPKEKALAAHHGDPKKITYGDVIKARLKSAAAKKMGK